MLVSGFTIIRNAEIMGYPVVEAIKSILPIVDEFVVGVGQSDDNTKGIIESIGDSKIKTFDSFWDTSKTTGGLILSEKTNEVLDRCSGDWAFYIQSDEVVHEADHKNILKALEDHRENPEVEGLLFDYLHFYGSYDVIATARNWYRREVRIVKPKSGIRSVSDAQGFRVGDRKPKVKPANARMFHYGWVKPPEEMGRKTKHFSRWWHGDKHDSDFEDFNYRMMYGLKPYQGEHPELMRGRIAAQNWEMNLELRLSDWKSRDWKNFASGIVEGLSGYRVRENKNYILIP